MKLPKSLKKIMKKFEKQHVVVKLMVVALILYAVRYVLKQFNISVLDSHYLEGLSGKRTFVFFKMNGCPHCEKMQGEWNNFVSNNNSGLATKELEATKNHKLAEKYGVQGYPTLLIVEGDSVVATFDGERNVANFQKFALKHAN